MGKIMHEYNNKKKQIKGKKCIYFTDTKRRALRNKFFKKWNKTTITNAETEEKEFIYIRQILN